MLDAVLFLTVAFGYNWECLFRTSLSGSIDRNLILQYVLKIKIIESSTVVVRL